MQPVATKLPKTGSTHLSGTLLVTRVGIQDTFRCLVPTPKRRLPSSLSARRRIPLNPAVLFFVGLDSHHDYEYRTLRDTIRQRGTARMVLVPLTFIGWAATAGAVASVITVAISTLVPLMVLAAGFEAVFALHMNVERIGRYLQVFHEGDDGWERVAMDYGRRFPGSGPDPLFARLFIFGVSANFLPAVLIGEPIEVGVIAVVHLALIYRIRMAAGAAARQRAEDLERYEQLRRERA